MTKTLRNSDIVVLFNALSGLNVQATPKFRYAVAKNREALKSHSTAISEARQFPEDDADFTEYKKRADEILRKYAVDDKGQPNMREIGNTGNLQRVVPLPKQGAYQVAMEELNDEFHDLNERMEAHREAFAKLLDEEVEVKDLVLINFKDLPEDKSFPQDRFNAMIVLMGEPEEERKEKAPPKKD